MTTKKEIKARWGKDRMPINPWKDVKFLLSEIEELTQLLSTAEAALNSYAFGNSSPDLAKTVAGHINKKLK